MTTDYTKEQKKTYLDKSFNEIMKNHRCGNYISIDDDCIEWATDSEAETFVAYTEFGTFTHHYNWDFCYDMNLQTFVEGVIEFVLNNLLHKENREEEKF